MPQGHMANKYFYCEFLERLQKQVACIQSDIKDTWMLYHDNAPCHTALSTTKFLTQKSIPVIHSPRICLTWVLVISFSSQNWKITSKDITMVREKTKAAVTDQLKGHSGFSVPALQWRPETTSQVLRGFPRELYWRRQSWNVVKLQINVCHEKVSLLYLHTSYLSNLSITSY